MERIIVDFNKTVGPVKAVNSVNNGPVAPNVRGDSNFEYYKDARIPFARLHDSAFYNGYGGEFSVDVHRIFPNFDADENDPKSYIFEPTDKYLKVIKDAGTEIFYRLGPSIEHGHKKGTYPPKDNLKWAKICEHIIRHYNEGWADGFYHDIKYWEIWFEPDCKNADGSNHAWQGTNEEFLEFYRVASKYLKKTFPSLKFGGPAICELDSGFARLFLPYAKENGIPMDFFSYHVYTHSPEIIRQNIWGFNELLTKYGFSDTEKLLNEFNYITTFLGEDWKYSIRVEKGLKGASYALSVMCVAQKEDVDMLMYYDARPCIMNGMFNTDTLEPLKTYYVYRAFRDIRDLGECAFSESTDKAIYEVASTDGRDGALLFTLHTGADEPTKKDISIEVSGAKHGECVRAEIYLLDDNNDLTLMREEFFTSDRFNLRMRAENYASYLVKFISE